MLSPVPGLIRSLTAFSKILTKAETYEVDRKLKPEVIPNLRLFPDMLPFWRQVTIASDHAKGVAARLAGIENPSFPDDEKTLGDLQARIAKTIAFLQSVPADAFEGAEARSITIKSGGRDLTFAAPDYLLQYALPNFYFHMATAYNILRAGGLEIGKVDFLGG